MDIRLMNIKRQFECHDKEYEDTILRVLRSGNYIGGDEVEKFEQEFAIYIGAKYAVSCGNGTDALIIALQALGIGQGDEVITTSFTFFATGESIARVGAKPVFVDVDKKSYCIDAKLIEEKINAKTKAILPVHLYGNCSNMQEIKKIANKYRLKVISDCAQAVGTKYNNSNNGILGDISCFSFFPTKNLGGIGDGGMIVTDDKELAYICKSFRVHGSGLGGKIFLEKNKNLYKPQIKEVPFDYAKYYNYFIGYNSRLDSIQAAVLRVKLKYIEDFINSRRKIAKYYDNNLRSDIYSIPEEECGCIHSYYVYVLQHENANEIMKILKEKGIESRTYYPVPLHLQVAFSNLNYCEGMLPETERLCKTTFAIPIYPYMTDEETKYVVNILNGINL